MSFMKCLLKCTYSKQPVLPRKTPSCTPVTFNLTFHPNFYPNILDFANLPIYRKSIHYAQKFRLVLKKRYIIFICKYWHYNLCQCYFEEDKNYLYSYLFALLQKFAQDVVPVVPIFVITSILLKLHQLSTIPEYLEQLPRTEYVRKLYNENSEYRNYVNSTSK